ncbi:MAG TPA: globin family protein [Phototrophicaceae bacterium]|nr:globin family protein [Phototrophicaceae bacterium]
MSLTDKQKALVQTTFGMVTDPDALAAKFYERLFETDPAVSALFKGDMKEQGKKLMQTLKIVVGSLDNLAAIVPAVQELGKRHVTYGVTADHWDTVGGALLWTLGDSFGDAFTDEIKDAWAAAYELVAQTAMTAAYAVNE